MPSCVSCLWFFSAAICEPENKREYPPALCTAPIKVGRFYSCSTDSTGIQSVRRRSFLNLGFSMFFFLSQYQFAKFKNDGYSKSGKGYLKLQLINQREDFSFALFSGGLLKVKNYCSF
jgi:hypothetical protein